MMTPTKHLQDINIGYPYIKGLRILWLLYKSIITKEHDEEEGFKTFPTLGDVIYERLIRQCRRIIALILRIWKQNHYFGFDP